MASKVEIANMALLRIGQAAIMNLNDNDERARRCQQELPLAMDATLRAYPWPFAVRRAELARLQQTPQFGYAFYYALPADCVRVVVLDTQNLPFQIEGRNIATNAPEVRLRYVTNKIETEEWDSQTTELLVLSLAMRLAIVTTENIDLTSMLAKQYDRVLKDARNTWAVEDMPQEVIEGNWLRVHEYGRRGHASITETFNPWGADGTGVHSKQ